MTKFTVEINEQQVELGDRRADLQMMLSPRGRRESLITLMLD